ncbi:MAG: hypothetical protein ISQ27_06915 [PS1 clade bacterium]|nr:hypothetical protein [PS1 clade bacterium]CAI8431326.1 MAG: Uncharacterised protein [Rhodobiaceae bacterium UBA7378]
MEEYQIWTLFNSARIGNSLSIIATILLIWLGLRTAMQTRTPTSGEEPNIIAKVLSTGFCALIVFFTYNVWTFASASGPITARALSDLKASGVEISSAAQGYIEYVGTTEPTGISVPGMVFLIIVLIMMLGQIWLPKQSD